MEEWIHLVPVLFVLCTHARTHMHTPESPANGFTPFHWSTVGCSYEQRHVVMNQQCKRLQSSKQVLCKPRMILNNLQNWLHKLFVRREIRSASLLVLQEYTQLVKHNFLLFGLFIRHLLNMYLCLFKLTRSFSLKKLVAASHQVQWNSCFQKQEALFSFCFTS